MAEEKSIPIPGKKVNVRKPDVEPDPEFQIAPMIDILLVLLVFFMSISSTEVLQASRDLELPVATDAAAAKQNPGQVIVNLVVNPLTNVTAVVIHEREYSQAELVPYLQNYIQASPMGRVLIRADRNVRYENLRAVLESVGNAGVGSITFSVVDRDLDQP